MGRYSINLVSHIVSWESLDPCRSEPSHYPRTVVSALEGWEREKGIWFGGGWRRRGGWGIGSVVSRQRCREVPSFSELLAMFRCNLLLFTLPFKLCIPLARTLLAFFLLNITKSSVIKDNSLKLHLQFKGRFSGNVVLKWLSDGLEPATAHTISVVSCWDSYLVTQLGPLNPFSNGVRESCSWTLRLDSTRCGLGILGLPLCLFFTSHSSPVQLYFEQGLKNKPEAKRMRPSPCPDSYVRMPGAKGDNTDIWWGTEYGVLRFSHFNYVQ
jgi:hypothetical protein